MVGSSVAPISWLVHLDSSLGSLACNVFVTGKKHTDSHDSLTVAFQLRQVPESYAKRLAWMSVYSTSTRAYTSSHLFDAFVKYIEQVRALNLSQQQRRCLAAFSQISSASAERRPAQAHPPSTPRAAAVASGAALRSRTRAAWRERWR